eukprot:TRINITY_DN5945_c0_g1_i2.p1 TRINITY_DN5945_c0_g1~~TRINITY_DN5945_c0_g1_i2.p1  ORF type:complete len:1909 (-),score=399.00 TRINITY_DN5945_c0_g1_i2:471-6197(-)
MDFSKPFSDPVMSDGYHNGIDVDLVESEEEDNSSENETGFNFGDYSLKTSDDGYTTSLDTNSSPARHSTAWEIETLKPLDQLGAPLPLRGSAKNQRGSLTQSSKALPRKNPLRSSLDKSDSTQYTDINYICSEQKSSRDQYESSLPQGYVNLVIKPRQLSKEYYPPVQVAPEEWSYNGNYSNSLSSMNDLKRSSRHAIPTDSSSNQSKDTKNSQDGRGTLKVSDQKKSKQEDKNELLKYSIQNSKSALLGSSMDWNMKFRLLQEETSSPYTFQNPGKTQKMIEKALRDLSDENKLCMERKCALMLDFVRTFIAKSDLPSEQILLEHLTELTDKESNVPISDLQRHATVAKISELLLQPRVLDSVHSFTWEKNFSSVLRQSDKNSQVTSFKFFALEKVLESRLESIGSRNEMWNERFQEAWELPEDTPDQKLEKYTKLSEIASDFVYAAETYGKIIISEFYLPNSLKTIKSANFGGIAGGTKFLKQGILYKVAVDSQGVYGYDDEKAMKACSHDIKGLMAYFQCTTSHKDSLHVPLACVIDYRGFRVIAEAILPIDDSTLKYGSSDAAKTVHKDHPIINRKMKEAASKLKLKGHKVGKLVPKKIYGPADIECHLGHDGRFYLLDFARVFPPEPPNENAPKGSHLFNLLRPELILQSSVPLSSDAFSSFGIDGKDEHNMEVVELTKKLYHEVIPQFANKWSSKLCDEEDDENYNPELKNDLNYFSENITVELHTDGINVRHLGLVRYHATSRHLKNATLKEMIARVVKNTIRCALREEMKKLGIPSQEPYIKVVTNFLNLVLCRKGDYMKFWADIKTKIVDKFGPESFTEDEMDIRFVLMDHVNLGELVLRILHISDITLTPNAREELTSNPNKFTFVDIDIQLNSRVKQLNIVNFSTAIKLSIEATRVFQSSSNQTNNNRRNDSNFNESYRLFKMATENFQKASETSLGFLQTYIHWAHTLHEISVTEPDIPKAIKYLKDAESKYKKIIASLNQEADEKLIKSLAGVYYDLGMRHFDIDAIYYFDESIKHFSIINSEEGIISVAYGIMDWCTQMFNSEQFDTVKKMLSFIITKLSDMNVQSPTISRTMCKVITTAVAHLGYMELTDEYIIDKFIQQEDYEGLSTIGEFFLTNASSQPRLINRALAMLSASSNIRSTDMNIKRKLSQLYQMKISNSPSPKSINFITENSSLALTNLKEVGDGIGIIHFCFSILQTVYQSIIYYSDEISSRLDIQTTLGLYYPNELQIKSIDRVHVFYEQKHTTWKTIYDSTNQLAKTLLQYLSFAFQQTPLAEIKNIIENSIIPLETLVVIAMSEYDDVKNVLFDSLRLLTLPKHPISDKCCEELCKYLKTITVLEDHRTPNHINFYRYLLSQNNVDKILFSTYSISLCSREPEGSDGIPRETEPTPETRIIDKLLSYCVNTRECKLEYFIHNFTSLIMMKKLQNLDVDVYDDKVSHPKILEFLTSAVTVNSIRWVDHLGRNVEKWSATNRPKKIEVMNSRARSLRASRQLVKSDPGQQNKPPPPPPPSHSPNLPSHYQPATNAISALFQSPKSLGKWMNDVNNSFIFSAPFKLYYYKECLIEDYHHLEFIIKSLTNQLIKELNAPINKAVDDYINNNESEHIEQIAIFKAKDSLLVVSDIKYLFDRCLQNNPSFFQRLIENAQKNNQPQILRDGISPSTLDIVLKYYQTLPVEQLTSLRKVIAECSNKDPFITKISAFLGKDHEYKESILDQQFETWVSEEDALSWCQELAIWLGIDEFQDKLRRVISSLDCLTWVVHPVLNNSKQFKFLSMLTKSNLLQISVLKFSEDDMVDEKFLISLISDCNNLDTLEIERFDSLTDKSLESIINLCPQLESLCIGSENFSSRTLKLLCNLHHLEELIVDCPSLTDSILEHLFTVMYHLCLSSHPY